MVDRPATSSTLLTTASGGNFQSVGLVPTAVGNATKIFDCDSGLTDTSISGAYIDEIWLRHIFETDTAVITGQNLENVDEFIDTFDNKLAEAWQ